MTLFFILEGLIPQKDFKRGHSKNLRTNIYFTVLGILVNILLASILYASSQWATANEFGLYYWVGELSLITKTIIIFLVLDQKSRSRNKKGLTSQKSTPLLGNALQIKFFY